MASIFDWAAARRIIRQPELSQLVDYFRQFGWAKRFCELEMASQTTAPLHAGLVLEITFPTFKPRITIDSDQRLTVEIIAGENEGFSDTVEYKAVAIRDGLVMLSWQEHIGSTIVHVLDLVSGKGYTAVTPAKGGFMRLAGQIEVKSH
jgi:hypothetical protein